MKRTNLVLLFISTSQLLISCDVVVGIFNAGFWTAMIVVVLITILVIWLSNKFRGRDRD